MTARLDTHVKWCKTQDGIESILTLQSRIEPWIPPSCGRHCKYCRAMKAGTERPTLWTWRPSHGTVSPGCGSEFLGTSMIVRSDDSKEFSAAMFVVSCLVQFFISSHPVSRSTQQRPALCSEWGRDSFLALHLHLKGLTYSDTRFQ